jgi:hypothetical protein
MRNQIKPLPDVLRAMGNKLRANPSPERCAMIAAALHVLADDFCLEKVVVLIPASPPPPPRYPRRQRGARHAHPVV